MRGKNVFLRKLRLRDEYDVYRNVNDWQVVKFLTRIPWPYKRKDATDFIRKTFLGRRRGTSYTFGICFNGADKVIGIIDIFNVDLTHRKAEVGYWLGRKNWGKGVMSEALELISSFAFDELKLHRLEAKVYGGNKASCRVLERNGFIKEGFLREAIYKWAKFHNIYVYGKLRLK